MEVREGDGVRGVWVVGGATGGVGVGVAPVVEEDGAAGDPVRGPVVDAAWGGGGGGADDVFFFGLV